jgi:23S rRNA (adenine2503-C2)-methyltransferase
MSGCPVGCRFCGAGDYFVRNANADEIVMQVSHALKETGVNPLKVEKLQVMFMSMGEPLLNKNGVIGACETLYKRYPKAQLLLSSIGPEIDYMWLYKLSTRIPTIGLQFSVHKTLDETRNQLIPFESKLTLKEIAEVGRKWHYVTGRKPYFNYCAGDDNSSEEDAVRLAELFPPDIWEATISVICESNDGMPTRNDHQRWLASDFSQRVLMQGFTVRVFDPAGQDDIGGGCGQLWGTQKWMADHPDKTRPSIGNGKPKIHVPTEMAPTMEMY